MGSSSPNLWLNFGRPFLQNTEYVPPRTFSASKFRSILSKKVQLGTQSAQQNPADTFKNGLFSDFELPLCPSRGTTGPETKFGETGVG